MMEAHRHGSPADRRFIILLAMQCVVAALLIVGLVVLMPGRSTGDRAELARDTAAKLQAAGLTSEAILQYESYLNETGIDPKTRASLSYSVGEMYENEGRPEKALAWYYRVGAADAGTPQAKEAAKKIVAILESLGRHQAAKSVLSGATTLEDKNQGGKSPAEAGKIVAQVGERKISLGEIDAAFDSIPPQMKTAFAGTDGKKNFLKKYVADELLLEKARRLQYDADPKWLKQLDMIKRNMLVGRVLQEEVSGKVVIEEKDLKNYFAVNKAKYAQNKKPADFDKVRAAVEHDYRMEKSEEKYAALVEQLVAGETVKLFVENVK